VVRGRQVAAGVVPCGPGSSTVKRKPSRRPRRRVSRRRLFWGESGCSCARRQWRRGEAGERCVSTTNRKLRGRQGKGVRTHLASPATAAAAAIAGRIVDVRRLVAGAA